MIKKIVHLDVDVDDKYSPFSICTDKGWKFNAGIKITIADMEFFAIPELSDDSPLFDEWHITDGITGAKVFVSPPIPAEKIDHSLDDVVTQFAIFLTTSTNGDLDALKSRAEKFLVDYEKRLGKKPEKAPEELIQIIEQVNATTLQTGEIVH